MRPIPLSPNPEPARESIPWLPLLGIAALAAALRLIGLGATPVWYDELFTATGVERPLVVCFTEPGSYVNPPLFYGIAALFDRLGDSLVFLRLPSALSGLASVVFVGVLAAVAFGRRAALFAAALLAVSAFDVRFSREARMYTMLGVATLATMTSTHLAVTRGRIRDWTVLAVSLAASMWIHYVAAPLAACVAFRVGVEILSRRTAGADRARLVRCATVTAIAVAILVAPLVPMFVEARAHQSGVGETMTTGAAWMQPAVIWSHFSGYAKSIESWPLARPAFALVALVLAIGFGAGIVRAVRIERPWAKTLLAFTILPAVLSLGYFALANPVQMTSRYQSFLFPGIALVCGIGLASIPRRGMALAALGFFVLVNGAASVHAIRTPVRHASGWQETFAALSHDAHPGDRFLALPDYYGMRYAKHFGSGPATRLRSSALDVTDVVASLDAHLPHDAALWLIVLDPYDEHVKQRAFERKLADALQSAAGLSVVEHGAYGDVRLLRARRIAPEGVHP